MEGKEIKSPDRGCGGFDFRNPAQTTTKVPRVEGRQHSAGMLAFNPQHGEVALVGAIAIAIALVVELKPDTSMLRSRRELIVLAPLPFESHHALDEAVTLTDRPPSNTLSVCAMCCVAGTLALRRGFAFATERPSKARLRARPVRGRVAASRITAPPLPPPSCLPFLPVVARALAHSDG